MGLGGLGLPCGACGCKPDDCFGSVIPTEDVAYFDNVNWMAGGIVVGGSSITLHSVTVYIGDFNPPRNPDGSLENEADTPYCMIYSSDTPDPADLSVSKPSALIVTLTPPTLFSGSTWTFTHAGLSLSANTVYWVVLGAGFYDAFWTLLSYEWPSGSTCYSLAALSGDGGFSFSQLVPPRYRFKFDIA